MRDAIREPDEAPRGFSASVVVEGAPLRVLDPIGEEEGDAS
jgi:hypothetical protein